MKPSVRLRSALLAFAAFLSGVHSAKAESFEAVVNEYIAQRERMLVVVAAVKDKATAQTAARELKAITANLKKLVERARSADAPTPAAARKLLPLVKSKEEGFDTILEALRVGLVNARAEDVAAFAEEWAEIKAVLEEFSKPSQEAPSPPQAMAPAPLSADEKKIEQILMSPKELPEQTRALIEILPTLKAEGQEEAAQHISNLTEDKDYHLEPVMHSDRLSCTKKV